MNIAVKAAIFNPQNHFINLRAALFHSTPVLERKRRSHWHTPRSHHNFNSYSKRFRRVQSKKSLLRNISAFADHLFQHWQEDINDDDPSSSRGTSWFKKDYGRSKQTRYQGHHGGGRRGAWINEELDEDEGFVDIEHVFESLFGRRQRSHWSFTYEDNTGRRSSYSYGYNYWDHQNWRSRDRQNWRFRVEEDYEFEEESEGSESDMASDVSLSLAFNYQWHLKTISLFEPKRESSRIAVSPLLVAAMSQVDNRNSSAAKRARTDGSRREDDWTCPSCGNVNFSFRMTCNMRNCTQPRPADHNSSAEIVEA